MFSDKNFGLNKSLLEAASTVLNEKKHHKGKHLDPVGKEDEDIDNDGDVDSSDRYLKNRRKAIAKNIKEEKAKEMSFPFPPASGKNAEIVKSMSEKPLKKSESQPKENMNESFFKVVGGALKGQKVKSIRRTATGHDVKTKDGKVTHITHDNLRKVLKEDFFTEEAERVTYHKKMIKRIEKILEDDPDNEHYREKLNYHKKLLKKLLSENVELLDEKMRVADILGGAAAGALTGLAVGFPAIPAAIIGGIGGATADYPEGEELDKIRNETPGQSSKIQKESGSDSKLKLVPKRPETEKEKKVRFGKALTGMGMYSEKPKPKDVKEEIFSEKEIEHIMNVLEVVNPREPDQTSPRQSGSSDRTNPTMPNNTLTDEVCKSCKSKKCKCH